MQNLGMILRLMKRIAPGLDVKAIAEEVRSRIGEELDYELEAQNQRSLARIFRGHPFIVVPDVVDLAVAREGDRHASSSTALGFEEHQGSSTRPTRDRVGEIVFRFFFGCLYRHHQFSGDPHPGNFLLLDDGASRSSTSGCSSACRRSCSSSSSRASAPATRATASGCTRLLAETGFLAQPERFDPDKLLAQFRDATWWYVLDEDIELHAGDRDRR